MSWPLFYGLLTTAVIWRAFSTSNADAEGAGIILCALFLMTNASHFIFKPADPYNQLYPACDFIAALIFALAWRDSMSPWKSGLILLLMLDVMMHAAFLGRSDFSHKTRYRYDLSLNLAYIGQLVCVLAGTFSHR